MAAKRATIKRVTHYRSLLLCLSVVAAACGGAQKDGADDPIQSGMQPAAIFQRSKPAIVRIETRTPQGEGIGTGFILGAEGRVVTNLHVIGGADAVDVVLYNGVRLPVQTVAAIDPVRDLAIVTVKARGELPTLAIGNSDSVNAGDPVVAIGNPLGVLDYTVSDGLISSIRPVNDELVLLQISAPISKGSSGGPLFNSRGEVIGIATFIADAGQNLNFGIPSKYLFELLGRDDGFTISELNDELQRLLAARLSERAQPTPRAGGIARQIPDHDLSLLDGCEDGAIAQAVESIADAIGSGAPVYNQGNHEACYRIYEGTAMRLERELACPGMREALGRGLLRASTIDDYTGKAWAMRDTFDGLLKVIEKRALSGADDATDAGE
ncbi:MAG: hypothetical protein Tsb0020_47420 [Haliangiales bacterium]